MLKIARLSEHDRRDLFRATAERMRVNEAVIEKDFWVCWTLDYLFHESPWKDKLAFKGGTSLSKAYGAIQRFSEDIDLVLDWTLLGHTREEPWNQESNSKRSAFCKKANEQCTVFLKTRFVPQVFIDLTARTPLAINVTSKGQDVFIHYPKAFLTIGILPQVKPEIGPVSNWFPQEPRPITPYAAECFPDKFEKPSTRIPTIKAERTFWDKVTILHQEAHREQHRAILPRYSRHYYDLYCMAAMPIKDHALQNRELLDDVVRFKMNFYHCAWASYETAVIGTVKLIPPTYNRAVLAADYKAMRTMLFGEVPSFDDILIRLAELESTLNS